MINTDDCTATEFIKMLLEQMQDNGTNHVAIPLEFHDETLYLSIELLPEEDMFPEGPELTSTRTLQ